MGKFVLILMMIFSLHYANAQKEQEMEPLTYTVKMGETVRMISKKFRIAPSEIYRLNRFAVEGVKEGMVLHILVPKKETAPSPENTEVVMSESFNEEKTPESVPSEEIKHTVGPKETLYSLSKKYNVPVEKIKQQNEQILKKGLQAGQVLTISTN